MKRNLRTAAATWSVGSILVWSLLLCGGGCRDSGEQPFSAPNAASNNGSTKTASTPTAQNIGQLAAQQSTMAARGGAKPTPQPAVFPAFVDIAHDAGIDFTFHSDVVPGRFFLPEIMGGGAAWWDYDNDGLLDLFLVDGDELEPGVSPTHKPDSRLYRNLGEGRFALVSGAAFLETKGYGQGCAVGDFDADGFPDLFIATYSADLLFRNQGDGTVELVTVSAGTSDDLWSSSAAWLDADGDGDLDLYVVNYMDVTLANKKVCHYDGASGYCGPGEYHGVPDRLWLNQGDGTFRDALEELGLSAPRGKGLALTIVDFDGDLRPEIYVANDMDANFLFTRGDSPLADPASKESPKRFAEVGLAAGCAVSGMGLNEASMGIALADFDNDGLPDLYLTHYYNAKNTLYHNVGGLTFVDDSFRSRSAANSVQSLGFGTVPIDFDRDGASDLFIANGHVLGPQIPPYEMHPQVLWNEGRARFWDVSAKAGAYFADKWVGRCAAGADFDNDGDTDVAVTHIGRPIALLRNDTAATGHFLGLDLRTLDRVLPLGGRVVVERGEFRKTVPVNAGGSYLASPDARLLIGVGDNPDPVKVEIHWPSGDVQTIEQLEVDRYWRVYPGQAPVLSPGSLRH